MSDLKGGIFVRRLIVFLSLLTLIVAMSFVLPAQAVRREPRASCFEVVGKDPNGMNHAVSFYHKPAANRLAASWMAEGWTGVIVNPC